MKLLELLGKQRSAASVNREERERELAAAEARAREIAERSRIAEREVKKHVPRDPWAQTVSGIARRTN